VWQAVLMGSAALCVTMSIVIFGSLIFNARLWLQDYPKPMQALVSPLSPDEKRLQKLLLVLFLVVVIGVPYLTVRQLRIEQGGELSFTTAYLVVFVILQIGNLFDALVIDWMVLAQMKPKFAILPGTEHLLYLFDDLRMHLVNYGKGVIIFTLFSFPIALAATL
jgi:hypothetical protein